MSRDFTRRIWDARSAFGVRVLLAAVLILLLSGCSIQRPVAVQAVQVNLALEKAQNEMLLLNVVRSMKELPTHYSAITQVLGTASTTLSPSITLPFGPDATSLFPLTLSASGTGGVSTLDVAVLDSKEFVQGIMNPISLDQLDYFLQQGWSQELLFLLFVRRVELEGEVIENHPGPGLKGVNQFLKRIRSMNIEVVGEAGTAVGPSFKLEKGQSLSQLILQAEQSGLVLQAVDGSEGHYRFVRKGGTKVLVFDNKRLALAHEEGAHADKVYLRSTDGIFAYLGGLLRHQDTSSPGPKVAREDGSEEAVLFLARKGEGDNDALLAVEHGGEPYHVPAKSAVPNHSMPVLSLLSQLIGLNKSRSELPSTGVVTISGG